MSNVLHIVSLVVTQILIWGSVLCAGAIGGILTLMVYEKYFKHSVTTKTPAPRDLIGSLRAGPLGKLARLSAIRIPAKYRQDIRRQLTRAGEPHMLTPEEFVAFQELGAIAFLLMALFFTVAVAMSILWWPFFVLLGFFMPWIWLRDRVTVRIQLITRALPFDIDLLTLAVGAGLDFTAAIGKVVEKGRDGPLEEEFSLMLRTLKLGKTREEALKAMAERVGLQSLTSFVGALVQADQMGTSLGKILRIQSTQLRHERTQRAEKLANEAPVKLLFPLLAFIFPTVFLILFGPIVYQALNSAN